MRTQLRSLLGAYWGFPLTNPAPLDPLRIRHQNWTWDNHSNLSQTARGGGVIPSSLNSATVAVWQAEGTPPAVVANDRATFFGWRWGFDTVANAQFDTAWLQAALSRYPNLAPGRTPNRKTAFLPPLPPLLNLHLLAAARSRLQTFVNAIEQQDYRQAQSHTQPEISPMQTRELVKELISKKRRI